MLIAYPLTGQAIDGRGLNVWIAIATQAIGSHGVQGYQHNGGCRRPGRRGLGSFQGERKPGTRDPDNCSEKTEQIAVTSGRAHPSYYIGLSRTVTSSGAFSAVWCPRRVLVPLRTATPSKMAPPCTSHNYMEGPQVWCPELTATQRNWPFALCDWLSVIFLWIKLKGTRFKSVRRILCLKLLPTRSNAGWCLLR